VRHFRWLLLIPLALALASCRDNPTGPPIGNLIVTPVAIATCPYTSPPLLAPQRLQMVECGTY